MKRSSLCLAVCLLSFLALAAPAGAEDFGLHDFSVTFTDSEGVGLTQAGLHPYAMNTSFEANTVNEGGNVFPTEPIKDLEIAQIPGFIGDQGAVPRCPALDFLARNPADPNLPECEDGAAVGVIELEIGTGEGEEGGKSTFKTPLYNLAPPPGKVARLGFWIIGNPVTIDVRLDEEPPYRLIAQSRNISQAAEFFGAKVTLWGVPASPAHDKERGRCYKGAGTCPAGVGERPFLTLPRACVGALATDFELDSWTNPGVWVEGSALTHDDAVPPNPRGFSGCGKLKFSPTTSAIPSTTSAESSSGLRFSLDVNDEGLKSSGGIAQADIEEIVTIFPPGVTANPSAAEGLGVCTKAQYEAESLVKEAGRGCPEASKLGTIEAETPLLENHPLHGVVYLAQQDDPATAEPEAENPFDSLVALYVIVRDPETGAFVKLAGEVEPDESSGRLVTTFEDLPPFPLSHVELSLRSGPRAPLVTPPTCGTYTTTTILVPSSGAEPLVNNSSFQIDSGPGGGPCPAAGVPGFNPGFQAGTVSNAAGRFSPFNMRITRGDGEQDLTRFSAVLPPGVVAKLAGVGRCPDASIALAKTKSGRQELASPSCPASSQIGRVLTGAGVGSALTYVPGSLYLAGPYNGAPLSVVAIVPAVAGPFDVGTVVTRVALTLNPTTGVAEINGAASDPIPHILKGIPLKVRDLRVYADRPDFTLNPTGCEPTATAATLFGSFADVFNPADDVPVSRAARFQAAECDGLGFKPKLSLSLLGATKRSGHPALKSVLTPRAGDANIAKAVVTLPPSQFIDNAHIRNPCTRVQFDANQCPPGSVLGTARAFSPLLDEPLEGTVYFRSNGGERLLPDVVADLRGVVRIILVGEVDSKNARIRTTFRNAPDAPVNKFILNLFGGNKGLLQNNRNLCTGPKPQAKLALTGHNGRVAKSQQKATTSCKGKGKKKRSGRSLR